MPNWIIGLVKKFVVNVFWIHWIYSSDALLCLAYQRGPCEECETVSNNGTADQRLMMIIPKFQDLIVWWIESQNFRIQPVIWQITPRDIRDSTHTHTHTHTERERNELFQFGTLGRRFNSTSGRRRLGYLALQVIRPSRSRHQSDFLVSSTVWSQLVVISDLVKKCIANCSRVIHSPFHFLRVKFCHMSSWSEVNCSCEVETARNSSNGGLYRLRLCLARVGDVFIHHIKSCHLVCLWNCAPIAAQSLATRSI